MARDRNYSEEVANAIDVEVRETIDRSYNKAKELLEQHLETLHLVARRFLKRRPLRLMSLRS